MTKKILIVGLCCIDVVNYVQAYPAEDSDTRVFDMLTCLGGNSANTSTVLTQLTSEVQLCASLPTGNSLLDQLISTAKIDISSSIIRQNTDNQSYTIPQSTVIVNETSGTRTVLHYRGNLPEIQAAEFQAKFPSGFEAYSWVHFEGRNFDELEAMISYVRTFKTGVPKISVEFEKIRNFSWFEKLINLVDYIFMSKDFAKSKGWLNGMAAVQGLKNDYGAEEVTIICPWGDEGVYALPSNSNTSIFVKAMQIKAVDTLGAGDCFIAAAIWALNQGTELEKALEIAVKIAGQKCTQRGLTNLQGIDEVKNILVDGK